MKKKIVIALVVAAVVGLLGWLVKVFTDSKPETVAAYPSYNDIRKVSEELDVESYDLTKAIRADENSGMVAEHIEGDIAKAKVVVVEYADFQCSYCAYFNSSINDLVEKYAGEVAVVYRTYLLRGHNNNVQAALAAEAADRQGVWWEFKDILLAEQDNWYYSNRNKFQKQLEEYFVRAAGVKADIAKFREDMRDEVFVKKLAFDMALGDKIDLEGTPSFYVKGEKIAVTDLDARIGEMLEK